MVHKNLTIHERHEEWADKNGINLSQFLRNSIDERIQQEEWETGQLVHEPGVTLGTNIFNDHAPVVHDRFRSPTDSNWLTAGGIGSGKTMNTLDQLAQRDQNDAFDTAVFYIDPLGTADRSSHLDAQHITVGGSLGVNPLMLGSIPEGLHDTALDPGMAKRQFLNSFFKSYYQSPDVTYSHTPEIQQLLNRVVVDAYDAVGINLSDPSTFDNSDPTIQDHLLPQLEAIATSDPKKDVTIEESWDRSRASELWQVFRAFEEDDTRSNLGGQSEVSFEPSTPTYFSLAEVPAELTGLMMQLVLETIFEWAKTVNQEVIIAIDEARYAVQDKHEVSVIKQKLRHARHYNVSIHLIMQSLEYLIAEDYRKSIIDLCSHKFIYRMSNLPDKVIERLSLNPVQADFVRDARSRTENHDGEEYIEGACYIPDKGWFALRSTPSKSE